MTDAHPACAGGVAGFPSNYLGLEGVTVVDAWNSTGMPEETFTQPIEVSMALPVSLTCELYRRIGCPSDRPHA